MPATVVRLTHDALGRLERDRPRRREAQREPVAVVATRRSEHRAN